MSRISRVLPVAVGLLVVAAIPAGAQGPERTGWWSTAPVDVSALPSPTAADGLHIANGPQGRLAFAALSYHLEPFSSATLTLHLAANTLVGTPLVIACPTVSDTWKAGGNQPTASAPAYACAGRSAPGLVSSDSTGATVSFLLDAAQQESPGLVSLAIVPAAGSTALFSFDLVKPTASAMVSQPVSAGRPAAPAEPTPSLAPTVAPASAAPAAEPQPMLPIGVVPPVATPVVAPAPALAPVLAPVAAPPAPLLSTGRLLPTAAQRRLGSDERAQRAALLLMFAIVGGVGYLIGHNKEIPLRLLGGRAPRVDPTEPVLPSSDAPMGGLGRFARPRTTAARKLT